MMTRPPRPARGFTMVEVLVAIFIMAMIAAMAWQGVDGIVRTRAISQARLEQLLRINTVLAQWEQDLHSIQNTSSQQSPTSVPPLEFTGNSLTLTRRTPEGIQLIVWSLRSGTWHRWAGPAVTQVRALREQWQSSRQFIGNEEGQLRTLTGIADWQLYYYRDNAWTNAQSSAGNDTGDPAGNSTTVAVTTAELPKGVRIVLTFAGDGLSGPVTRDIELPPQPPSL
jgi:general secretion pathway protein J